MMQRDIEMVWDALPSQPERADSIANITGLPVEEVYHALVQLYDCGRAVMSPIRKQALKAPIRDCHSYYGWAKP